MQVLELIQAEVMVTVAALAAKLVELVPQLAMAAKYLEELEFVLLMPVPFKRCLTLEQLHICELYWNESTLGFSILAFSQSIFYTVDESCSLYPSMTLSHLLVCQRDVLQRHGFHAQFCQFHVFARQDLNLWADIL